MSSYSESDYTTNYLYVPNSYTANTVVSTIALIGGQTLANVGFNSGTCYLEYQVDGGVVVVVIVVTPRSPPWVRH